MLLGDHFVGAGAGNERRVHVNVVTAKVERDEELEEQRVVWVARGQEAEQTRGSASVISTSHWSTLSF